MSFLDKAKANLLGAKKNMPAVSAPKVEAPKVPSVSVPKVEAPSLKRREVAEMLAAKKSGK